MAVAFRTPNGGVVSLGVVRVGWVGAIDGLLLQHKRLVDVVRGLGRSLMFTNVFPILGELFFRMFYGVFGRVGALILFLRCISV